jgi:hypothetical protein
MPRTNPWSQSVSRIEIDQRSREARLRFERTNRLFLLSATSDALLDARAAFFVHSRQDAVDWRERVE